MAPAYPEAKLKFQVQCSKFGNRPEEIEVPSTASMAEVGDMVAKKFGLGAAKIRPPQGLVPSDYISDKYLRDTLQAKLIRKLIQTLYIDEVNAEGRGQAPAGAGQAASVPNQYKMERNETSGQSQYQNVIMVMSGGSGPNDRPVVVSNSENKSTVGRQNLIVVAESVGIALINKLDLGLGTTS